MRHGLGVIRAASIWITAGFLSLSAVSAQTIYPDFTSPYVNDFADILPEVTERLLEDRLKAARTERDHEMTIVTMNSLLDYKTTQSIERYAKNLFNEWGVGNAERKDGILMLVVVGDREMRIALGSAYPARYDGIAKRIIDTEMLPQFRANNYARGILAGTEASLERLQLIDRSAPLSSPERWQQERRIIGSYWRENSFLRSITYVFSALFAFFGGRWALYRRPRKCPDCGRVMFRLGDVQEDQYLSQSQVLEEKLGSADYGVWICNHDEHVTIEGKNKWLSSYKACPQCSSRTQHTRRHVVATATEFRTGTAQLHHSCKNCDYRKQETIVIPRITRSSSSSSSSSSSGGGRSSFGGGSSSGGGASGSW